MKTSDNGIKLIQEFEGLRLTAYQDSVGVWTIGYGHTYKVKKDETITKEQAVLFLISDLKDSENAVNDLVKKPLNQNQFDALVSFVFNLGKGNFQSSTLLRLLNQGKYFSAANEFLRWNKAGGKVLAGLTRRREAEYNLFLS